MILAIFVSKYSTELQTLDITFYWNKLQISMGNGSVTADKGAVHILG